MNVCEHSWTPYVNLPVGNDWGKDDVFERCERCGVVHTVQMVPPSVPIYDDKGYFIEPTEVYFTKDMIPQNRRYLGSRLPPMLKIGLDQPHGNRRLLQIGPGVGQLVQPLTAWGWQVECCEVGQWSSRYLHEAYPTITVHRADWMEWQPPYPYDAITGNHVLEHFRDAPAALEKMVDWLAPGGKLHLELPAQLFDDGTSNERAWPNGLHNHDHWWHFSERTLRTWCENLGLVKIGFANTIREYEDNKLMDYHIVAVKPT